MAQITLVTGGSRSGKSGFAQRLAEEQAGTRLFLATCPVTDPEMAARIARHRRERLDRGWLTAEEPLDLVGVVRQQVVVDVILIDCLTLWINNLMYEAEQNRQQMTEDLIEEKVSAVLAACRDHHGQIIIVTNEVGLGIVPENQSARLFRDLVGRCNQCAATCARDVYLVSCGIPLQLKGTHHALSTP